MGEITASLGGAIVEPLIEICRGSSAPAALGSAPPASLAGAPRLAAACTRRATHERIRHVIIDAPCVQRVQQQSRDENFPTPRKLRSER
jgi:hypothetical protein